MTKVQVEAPSELMIVDYDDRSFDPYDTKPCPAAEGADVNFTREGRSWLGRKANTQGWSRHDD